MQKADREFQVFVKPVGSACNLRCSYCYYINNTSASGRPAIMSDKILELCIRQNLEATTGNTTTFSWHGGEPLLAGIGFYRKAIKLQNKCTPERMRVLNGIQTNGTLIDSGWAGFLHDEGFFVGLSIDGPADMHDAFRRTTKDTGSFSLLLKGYEFLKKFNVPVELLCVVSSVNVRFPVEVYSFLKSLGAGFITFLPLVEIDTASPTGVTDASVGAKDFGEFLCRIFDEWKTKDIGIIKVQIIEEALRSAFNQGHTLCIFREKCGGVPVLEHDGSFYSCDHFVNHEHLIGNISDGSIAGFLDSESQSAFGDKKKSTLPNRCIECPVLNMCNGECPKNRFIRTDDPGRPLNYLCEGYKSFFNYCKPFAEAVSKIWKISG